MRFRVSLAVGEVLAVAAAAVLADDVRALVAKQFVQQGEVACAAFFTRRGGKQQYGLVGKEFVALAVGIAAAPVDEVLAGSGRRAVVLGAGDDDGIVRLNQFVKGGVLDKMEAKKRCKPYVVRL